MEMHFHLARTLTRVERRTEVAKMGRAWRAWGEVVRAEGEAELQALERHYHVAQTAARVVARAHERRLLRAWSLWARLAARGGAAAGRPAAAPRVSASLSSFPPGLLAAARNPRDAASLVRVSRAHASWAAPLGSAQGASAPAAAGGTPHTAAAVAAAAIAAAAEREQQARRSRAAMYKAGASTVRVLFRRAEARSLSQSWHAWRGATTADAAREARGVLGATRVAELFAEARENCRARLLHRGWSRWVALSTAEGARLEREAEAASWAVAEGKERAMKAAAAAQTLAAVADRWGDRVLRARLGTWAHAAELAEGKGAGATATEAVKTPRGDTRGAIRLGGVAPFSASPASAVSLLRSKLRGEGSPGLSVLPVPSAGSWKSPGDEVPPPHGLAASPPVPVALAGGLATPTSPLVPLGFSHASRAEGRDRTPGGGQAWSDQLNYSSSPCSPSQPPAGASGESASAAKGRARLETGALFPGGRVDRDLSSHSLDLTASADSVQALRPHAAGGAASSPLGLAAASAAAGSPEGSLAAYMSDSSPLLGERVLVSRGGDGGLALVSGEDAEDGNAAAGVLPSAVHAHTGESEGRGTGTSSTSRTHGDGTTRMTPESRRRLSRRSPQSVNSGGKIGVGGRARLPKSPAYVEGSVGALSFLGRDSPPWDAEEGEGWGDTDGRAAGEHRYSSNARERDQEEEAEEGGLVAGCRLEMPVDGEFRSASEGQALQSSARLVEQYEQKAADDDYDAVRTGTEFYAVGDELARAAEDFVDIVANVLWRRAFTRWARVSRDAAFHQKEADMNLKVHLSTYQA